MAKNLVIVESPTKARTITKFLGKDYQIESSFGHVRDLPKSKMGIDIEHNFEPKYIVPLKAKKTVTNLKKLAKKAGTVYFATDEDREGEAISWHLAQILDVPAEKAKRIAFHEITKEAILKALENPRELDISLVDAQQARRILDRLVGYELSPFLWKKIYKGLSAGRVQSVAVRLIVERERERLAFKPEEFWTIEAIFEKDNSDIKASLFKIDDKKIAKLGIKNKEEADKILNDLQNGKYKITAIESKDKKRNPLPPFTTSTLQQAANNHLGFSAKQTMMFAQKLYETGYITYMRTDSLNLADKFLNEAGAYINSQFGKEYASRRVFKSKQKGAQEAHEAIRPTEANQNPDDLKTKLEDKQFRLYDLIWRRSMACQMAEAILGQTSVDIQNEDNKYTFRANGSQVKFLGWLKVWPDKATENILPDLKEQEELKAKEIKPNQHFTEPPPRFTEASLVKALEEKGIGRPSTYAPTISTIVDRKYIIKEEKRLAPTEIGMMVNDLLVKHFPKIVDFEFTAKMEKDLDAVAEGQQKWQPLISDFYQPFKQNLMQKEQEVNKQDLIKETTEEKCEKCGSPMIVKMGRYGKFLACSGYPKCHNIKSMGANGEAAKPQVLDEKCPDCGSPLTIKRGRFGQFTGCSNYPNCKYIKKEKRGTGVKCPSCNKGEIVAKRSRRGKTFYACDQYPECKNAYWSKPTGEKCPDCGKLLVAGAKETIQCSNKECGYKK
ncbi:MAG: type I DNA topoisomerase [Patescibacteria group bacterium]|jgi:DNA topoisomerase-1